MENLSCVPDTYEVIYINLNDDYLKVKKIYSSLFSTRCLSFKNILTHNLYYLSDGSLKSTWKFHFMILQKWHP